MHSNSLDHTNNPLFAILLVVASAFGGASLLDIDIILAIVLKSVSILSFLIAIGYGIWKWKTEYAIQKKNKNNGIN